MERICNWDPPPPRHRVLLCFILAYPIYPLKNKCWPQAYNKVIS